ncbi:MAG: thioredoxin [Clostridia bacterium]|nr:thioredoxin [Clostridia bacterium]
MSIVTLTSKNYNNEVNESNIPVLIDFWATWCGPCQMMSPVIDEIAAERQGSLKVCKVNVDEEAELANRFNISSIPTLVLIKGGRVEAVSTGYRPKEDILRRLGI